MPLKLCDTQFVNVGENPPNSNLQPPTFAPLPRQSTTMIRPTTPPNPQPPLTKPTRSTTAPVKAHRHHISHHSHRVHRHHHDKSVPQTAIQPTISNPFGDFLARSTSRIDGSKTPPRPQQQQQQQIEAEAVKELQAREEAEREKEREKWAVVERMRARRKAVDGYVFAAAAP